MRGGKLVTGVLLLAVSVGMLVLAGVAVTSTRRATILHDQGVRELRSGNYEHARGFLEQALDARPDEPAYLANYGICLEMLGDYPGATDAYRRSLEVQEDAEVRFRLGRASCLGGEAETGVQLMWQAHSSVLLTARQAGDLGLCLERSGRYEQAIPYLEQGLTASPDHPELQASLAKARPFAVSAP